MTDRQTDRHRSTTTAVLMHSITQVKNLCQACSEEEETSCHFVRRCPANMESTSCGLESYFSV